jgi:hypothetical protein
MWDGVEAVATIVLRRKARRPINRLRFDRGIVLVGLIGWHHSNWRGEVLKTDVGPVMTVMGFGQSFPLDPLPAGWRHRKFWTRAPMTMSRSRTTCRACGSKLTTARRCCFAPSISISPPIRSSLALVHRVSDPQPTRRAHTRRRRSPGAAIPSVPDGSRRQARHGI